MSGDEKLRKISEAMEKDEKLVADETAKLMALHKQLFMVKVVSHGGAAPVPIQSRQLEGAEIWDFRSELSKINPGLLAGKVRESELETDQARRVFNLYGKYIQLATGIPQEKLPDNLRIRTALMFGILKGSQLSEEEMEDLSKFRHDV